MDPRDVTAILFGATGLIAWAKLILDWRQNRQGTVQALWIENRQLRTELGVEREERHKVTDRVGHLETRLDELLLTYRLLRRVVLTDCPKGVDCPLWPYLDGSERRQLLASLEEAEPEKG